MSMLVYVIGLIVLCSGIYFIRKSEEKQNAVIYLVFTAVCFMIVQAVEAGIINRIPVIGINAVSFGVLHIVEGAALWYMILAKKCRQEYYFSMVDVTVLVILAVLTAIVAVRQFGVRLNDFNFELSDSARHYMYSRNVADKGQLIGLYFASLNSGLIMNMFNGIIDKFLYYRIFILYEVGILFLNGAMFWAVIRRYLKDKFSIGIGIVLTAFYMLGYPWNSMVFGTAYLSTSILCVIMILFLLDVYFYNAFNSKIIVLVLLVFSIYALLHSYSLFVPPVLCVTILIIIYNYVKEHSVPARKIHKIGGSIIAVGLLAGIIFLYLWIGKGKLDKELDALSWWGYIYGTLYADFLFAIPFCIYGIVKNIKSKIYNTECMSLLVFIAYTFVLLLGNFFGKISAYYYYKSYYILWIAVFLVMLKAIVMLKNERTFMISYIFTWGLLFVVYIGSLETRLSKEYNLDLLAPNGGKDASGYFCLYNFNIVRGHDDTISKQIKELYMEAAKISEQLDVFIPYIGEYAESEWTYFALAGKEHKDVLIGKNYETAVEELKKYPYIISVECEEPMIDVSNFLNTLPVIYENEAGKIYKVETQTKTDTIEDKYVDIILRHGLPRLERMGWVEQDEYVNSLQVIKKIDNLGLNKREFLYPELEMEKIEDSVSHLVDGQHNTNRKEIIFTGTTSEELQHIIDNYPGAMIDIRSKQIELHDTITLRNNTAISGSGVKLVGYGLESAFIGENISDIYLNDICIEGKVEYGICLADSNDISISNCIINKLFKKGISITGNTRKVSISGNEVCNNITGGIFISGNMSDCLIESNTIKGNGERSNLTAGIVLENVNSEIYCPHDIIIRNNQISNNASLGIYSKGAYKCYMIDNDIEQNVSGGVGLENGTLGFYLEGNFIKSNGDMHNYGITLNNAAYNIFKNNIIDGCYTGIKMVHTSVRNLIIENIICGSEGEVCYEYGIEVGSETEINNDEEIDVTPSYENIICRNSIMGNYYAGVFIDEGCYVNDVFDNMIMEVKAFSVEAVSDMFNSIINNSSNLGERNEYNES